VIGLRKIALILSLIMVWGMAVASAAITRGQDDFSGGATINSGTNGLDHSELKSLYFRKIIDITPIEYEIQATKIASKSFAFLNSFIEMKTDDNPVRKIVVKESSFMPLAKYSDIIVSVPNDIVQEIKSAKRIALRFQTAAGSYVFVLPDTVLAEWQQVINTEK
jgi:hypothetical protein